MQAVRTHRSGLQCHPGLYWRVADIHNGKFWELRQSQHCSYNCERAVMLQKKYLSGLWVLAEQAVGHSLRLRHSHRLHRFLLEGHPSAPLSDQAAAPPRCPPQRLCSPDPPCAAQQDIRPCSLFVSLHSCHLLVCLTSVSGQSHCCSPSSSIPTAIP